MADESRPAPDLHAVDAQLAHPVNDGGPAFPLMAHAYPHDVRHDDIQPAQMGMSLRDYFAANALIGLSTTAALDQRVSGESVAARAYEFADALLAARGRR